MLGVISGVGCTGACHAVLLGTPVRPVAAGSVKLDGLFTYSFLPCPNPTLTLVFIVLRINALMPLCAPRQERDQAVQKRAYRLLAYVCGERPDFAAAHLAEVLEALLAGVATSLSAAKRYRLRCLQAGAPGRPAGPPARVLCGGGADRRPCRQAWPSDDSARERTARTRRWSLLWACEYSA